MSTNKTLIVVAAVAAVILIAGGIEWAKKGPSDVPKAAIPPAQESAQAPEETPCTPLYAYVLSKEIVKQAARDAESIVFPSFEAETVEQSGEWFLVTAYFIRAKVRVPFMVSLRCIGGSWEVGQAQVNNAPAFAGANL